MTRAVWVLLACAACAGNPGPGQIDQNHPPPGTPDFQYTGDQVEFKLAHETQVATATLTATKEQTWKALVIVYQDLGFAVGFANQDGGRLGNSDSNPEQGR